MTVPARLRLRSAALAVLLGLVGSLLVVPAAPAAFAVPGASRGHTAARPPVPRLRWVDCGDGLECATAHVPLDYDHPHGALISLALIRLPAGDHAHRIGSIFLNPGGPGGSGVDMVRGASQFLFSDAVRARFDLVGFDPRGIARSTPLRCFGSFDQAIASLAPFPFPVTKLEERIQAQSDSALAAACARRAGPILNHMSTANTARDMDLLRQAVGDPQLTYYGVSYGSYLGTTYANLFPGKVRALVVDGVLDPIAWATGRSLQNRRLPFSTRLRSDIGAYATLQEFFRLCDQGGANCAFSEGNPAARYHRLALRVLANPPDLLEGTLTYADLVATTLGALYEPQSWPAFATFLQELDANTSPLKVETALHSLRTQLTAQQEYWNLVEGFPGVACSDSDNPDRPGAWPNAAGLPDRAPYFGRIWTWASSICGPWPGRDTDRYTGPFTKVTSNPVLVIDNRFDPATRYEGAVTVANLLPRSRLLTLNGWGHTSFFKSTCIDAYLNRYLMTTALPRPGAVCKPDVVPFAAPASEGRAGIRPAARSVVISSLRRAVY